MVNIGDIVTNIRTSRGRTDRPGHIIKEAAGVVLSFAKKSWGSSEPMEPSHKGKVCVEVKVVWRSLNDSHQKGDIVIWEV